jgi:hypothetical protein
MSSKNMVYGIAIMGLLYNNTCSAEALVDRLTAITNTLQALNRAFSPTFAPELKARLDMIIDNNFKPKHDVYDKLEEYEPILGEYKQYKAADEGYYVGWGLRAWLQDFLDSSYAKSRPEILEDYIYDSFDELMAVFLGYLAEYDKYKSSFPDHTAAENVYTAAYEWLMDQSSLARRAMLADGRLYESIDVFDGQGNFIGLLPEGEPNGKRRTYTNRDIAEFQNNLDTVKEMYGENEGVKGYQAWVPILQGLVGKSIGTHENTLPKKPQELRLDELANLLNQEYDSYKQNKAVWLSGNVLRKEQVLDLIGMYKDKAKNAGLQPSVSILAFEAELKAS